jgi:glyoxylase-like metal-dependent hydrolase (beta-lactamase superfamily II)
MAVGPIMANCFIVGCEKTKEAAVIDPGDEADRILKELADSKLTVKYIINTHGHFDHVGANKRLKEVTGAEIVIHPQDAPMLSQLSTMSMMFGMHTENSPDADKLVEDGDTIKFGEIEFKVIHTPGHTPGGISLLTDDVVFVGDTLFQGSIGRTDFPGGDYQTLINSVREKLFVLNESTKVYCGHNFMTTIGQEKKFNPFFA